MSSSLTGFTILAAAGVFACLPSFADVPTPPAPPSPPAGYCSTIYTELQGYLDSFNQTLGNPAPYPTLQIAQLQLADSNTGPALSGPNYLADVMIQVQQLKAMGFDGVKVEVAFPVLYEPFFGSQQAMQPYLDFYTNLAANLKTLGMKLVVEYNSTLSTGTEAGWSNVGAFYNTLNWTNFIAARATMAGTVAKAMQPDFLMLSEEPDNEALNTGQPNLNDPVLAATMITGEIATARLNSLTAKLGAGFGTWMGPYSPSGLLDYLAAYVALPLDYIDMHIYPINTEYGGVSNLLNNSLVIASGAAAALKPVAVSEAWAWKMENAEFNKVSPDTFRARNPFSFWAPLDAYFVQTMQKLANYSQMVYMSSQGNDYFLAYQTYGGTTDNGGAANCTCTTATCSQGDIVQQENLLASNAGQSSIYTTTGLAYNSLLVSHPDTTPPSAPSNLAGTAGYASATLSWTGSTDNIGIAGYNVYRCSPPPCTGTWIANATVTSFVDVGLTKQTEYQYQVQAFDIANNKSATSNMLTLTTAGSTPPNAPTNLAAVTISPKQINLSWTAPQNSAGLSKYMLYSGTSQANMVLVATLPATSVTYQSQPLDSSTTYYYGLVAFESGLGSPMSNVASATTLPLPNAPSSVTATVVSASKISLSWKEIPAPGGLAIANYQVYKGTTDGVFTKIATVTGTTYSAMSLLPATTYYFEIVATDKSFNVSIPSDPISAVTYAMPPAPNNVKATATAATKVNVTWQWSAATGGLPAARYNIYCGTAPTGQPKAGTSTTTSFTWTGATATTQYYCYVVAVDTGNDNSPGSGNATATTPPMPNAPTNVKATASSSTKVTVTWTENPPPGGLPVSSYKVYRSTTLPVTLSNFLATRTTTSFTDTGVVGATTYYYAISAIDSGQDASPLSVTATVTTP